MTETATPRRLRLDVSYLGTRFEGWQAQEPPRGGREPRTVQGVLELALSGLLGTPLRLHGAGRTDAGVHAEGQVAHVDLAERAPAIPPGGRLRALNGRLPEDVRVTDVAAVPPGWHARFSASGKRYRYRLRRGLFLPPHAGLVEALAHERLDVAAMREAARRLVGRRDFARFALAGGAARTTVRTLALLTIEEEGPVLVVTAEGDGFLRGMVRRLVGTLREAGRGRIRPDEAPERPGPTAQARGLTLVRVFYPPEAPGEGEGEAGGRGTVK